MEEVAASGRKAIIFSQWVDTLQHLARELAPIGRWNITAASPASATT